MNQKPIKHRLSSTNVIESLINDKSFYYYFYEDYYDHDYVKSEFIKFWISYGIHFDINLISVKNDHPVGRDCCEIIIKDFYFHEYPHIKGFMGNAPEKEKYYGKNISRQKLRRSRNK